jgi:hypothetical protein
MTKTLSGSLPPSPPAEKTNARQDQARKASTRDGAGAAAGNEDKKAEGGGKAP